MLLHPKSHTLDVTGFSWNFWGWHLYTKTMTLCVMWSFYIQKDRHFTKSKTICDTFYIQKFGTFALRDFSLNFWNLRRGGAFIDLKTIDFAWHFYIEKIMHFALSCDIQRAWHYVLHFNIQKTIHFSLRFFI